MSRYFGGSLASPEFPSLVVTATTMGTGLADWLLSIGESGCPCTRSLVFLGLAGSNTAQCVNAGGISAHISLVG